MKDKVEEILDSLIAAHSLEVSENEKEMPQGTRSLTGVFPDRNGNFGRKGFGKKEYRIGNGREHSRAAGILLIIGLLAVVGAGIVMILGNVEITSGMAASGRALPIYCVETGEAKISLTFDAAWGNEDTAEILRILKEHGVKATFFMTGGWVEAYPEDVKAILADGHDLGNHSENHKNMSSLPDSVKKEEIRKVHNRVKELTGYEMFLFRPPYGDYDNSVIRTAEGLGYYSIQWDVDSLDWKDYGVESIISMICDNEHLGNGSIILCHNGAKFTAQALEMLITKLQGKGYQLVPVSELIYREHYYMDHEGRQIPEQMQ